MRKRPAALAHLNVFHTCGLLCSRRDLEEKLPIHKLTSIIILADESDEIDATSKDSQALTTLLLLRDIQSCIGAGAPPEKCRSISESEPADEAALDWVRGWGRIATNSAVFTPSTPPPPAARVLGKDCAGAADCKRISRPDASPGAASPGRPRGVGQPGWSLLRAQADKCAVISEILDSRTCQLISDAGISDFVLSNEVVSMTLAMVAEDRTVNRLLKILMESEGSELHFRSPSDLLVDTNEPVSFRDVMALARKRPNGPEIVLGHMRRGQPPVLNPPDKATPKTWSSLDQFIVLAEA